MSTLAMVMTECRHNHGRFKIKANHPPIAFISRLKKKESEEGKEDLARLKNRHARAPGIEPMSL